MTALNVMTRNGLYRAHVQAMVQAVTQKTGCVAIILAFDGACRCDAFAIDAGHVAVIEDVTQPMRIEAVYGTSFLVTLERVMQ
ncbi:hypothetical protein QCE73_38635 [Caballeronia sp. LZ029]|uniref:hypothetical protein n=1 Tax=Caballeronia sp. LZ029 TaxID=3038564 RepID=UPI002859AA3F|nr:hypothetical protein [Caballeronia sp. LZ029]MDR5749066.1 hypothetical protein [Caballeronia sp. LZ029]